jgi:hypothetical protein
VRAALLAVCYASLLLAAGLPHGAFGCGHTPRPHCSACASLQTIPIIVEADSLDPNLRTGRFVVVEPQALLIVLGVADTVTRAPPAPHHG